MLQPKRTKFRKQHKGRIRGEAKGGSDLNFGTYGLKALQPDRIPVNFLNPIAGTALENIQRLRPLEALHIVAALRIILPEHEIQICGGREVVLQSLQPLLFIAGASGIMTGNYLTTSGQGVDKDRQMLDDLGLNIQTKDSGL